ncbi:unnamed protein product [Notodromas monacha]|uniref:Ig-like domain-containing protein n=1 Tax=Notodromas monacha TaxID=399045 RepID=A0A7R9BGQ0_9CRUS|nr:unnamed protein product [Notodromas monacha]CAG0914304.1 unnamed protein product [Notodromas monacha]
MKKPEFLEELQALLTEAGTVSLECKCVGVPTPVLKWYKDGKEIKPGDVFALSHRRDGDGPDDESQLGTYTCQAVNCMGIATSTSRVRVTGKSGSQEGNLGPRPRSSRRSPGSRQTPQRSPTPAGPPPELLESLTNQRVKVGEPLFLQAKAISPAEPRATWYHRENPVESSEKYRMSIFTVEHAGEDGAKFSAFALRIDVLPAEVGDEGDWKCEIHNDGGKVDTTCNVRLAVPKNYRPPRFLEELKAMLTEEGLVSFECKVVGFPTPTLRWYKDGHELKPGDVYQLSGTNSLGHYACVAKNCMGIARSEAELTIADIEAQLTEEEMKEAVATVSATTTTGPAEPPVFKVGLRDVEAKLSELLQLTVQVDVSRFQPKQVIWYHEGEEIIPSGKFSVFQEVDGIFQLEVSSAEINDQGTWKCAAVNDIGERTTSCHVAMTIPKHYKKPRFLEPLRAVLSEEGTVIGVPQPILKWFKDNEELRAGDIHRIMSGQDGTCCLGTYTCVASNCMGSASSSAALLGFEERLPPRELEPEQPAGKRPSIDDHIRVTRHPSLSTINEERSSQIGTGSFYETPMSDISSSATHDGAPEDEEKAELSVSIDGRDVSVSVSLYETPDISELDAQKIVEIFADELSEYISAKEVINLSPLRFVKEVATSGNILMEATVVDMPGHWSAPAVTISEFTQCADDLCTEADIDELSAMEAIMIEDVRANQLFDTMNTLND